MLTWFVQHWGSFWAMVTAQWVNYYNRPHLMTLVSPQEPTVSHICNQQTPKMRFEARTGEYPRSSKASLPAKQQSSQKQESLSQQGGRGEMDFWELTSDLHRVRQGDFKSHSDIVSLVLVFHP